ncbi:MAG: glycosyltransferase 87 family protein [Flavobacteriia bacterium]|jgi:hypothetical protein
MEKNQDSSAKKAERKYLGYIIFGIFLLLFTILMVLVEIKNGRFWTNDLKVYYDASSDYFRGNNPYLKPYGLSSGFFKYPPPTLYFFWIYTKLNYFTVQIIHIALSFSAFLISLLFLHKLLSPIKKDKLKEYSGILWLAFVFVAIHLVREFHLGNINLLLLFLFINGLFWLERNDKWTALSWSLLVLLKPFLIIVFLPLLIYKKWKLILLLISATGFFMLLPLIVIEWTSYLELWQFWLIAILKHGEYQVTFDSLSALTNHYFRIKSEWGPSLLFGLIFFFVMYWTIYKNFTFSIIDWMCFFLAFSPSFFKTDTQHFILSLPLILLLLKELINQTSWLRWSIFVLLMAGFSLNSNDLLGKNLGKWVTESGLLGLSNLGLMVFFIFQKISIKKI